MKKNSKQIGWTNEAKLLAEVSNQILKLTKVIGNGVNITTTTTTTIV